MSASKKSGAAKTNAARILDNLGIAYQLCAYEADLEDLSAVHAAQGLGADPERVFKTLAVRGDKSGVVMACIPGPAELDLKKLARASGNKSMEMVPLRELTGLTGYVRGGCSPVGLKKPYPVVIEENALLYDEIYVSAGQRGLNFSLSPEDLSRAVNAVFADICAASGV